MRQGGPGARRLDLASLRQDLLRRRRLPPERRRPERRRWWNHLVRTREGHEVDVRDERRERETETERHREGERETEREGT